MEQYFPCDSYETPDSVPRHPFDVLSFGTRWGLYAGLAGAVFEARRAALDGVYDDAFWARSSYRVMHLVERCGGRFHIDGFDHIRSLDGPAVFVSNHMSTLETQVLPVLIVPIRRVTFVVKEQLVEGPIFGPIMRSRKPVTVSRKHPGKDLIRVLEGGAERIENGTSVIVFPQSTRVTQFDPEGFNSLGAKLAHKTGVPVIPVALKTDFWENGTLLRGFGPIRKDRAIYFSFGPPLAPELGTKTVHQRTVDFIQMRLASWEPPREA